MPRVVLCLCTVLVAQGCAVAEGPAQETADGSDCFYPTQVRNYQVVDEQHIAVNATTDRVYLVELRRPVRNLRRARRIAFQSPTKRICSGFGTVLVDGRVRIRSIQRISEAERDALLSPGGEVEHAPVDGSESEGVTADEPAQQQEEGKQ